jgi:hypothetical protein
MPYSGSLIWLLLDSAGHRCQPVLRQNAARAEIDPVLVLLERSRQNLARQRLAASVRTPLTDRKRDTLFAMYTPKAAQILPELSGSLVAVVQTAEAWMRNSATGTRLVSRQLFNQASRTRR